MITNRDERIRQEMRSARERRKAKKNKETTSTPLFQDPFIEEVIESFLNDMGIKIKDSMHQTTDKLKRDYEAMKLCCSHQAEEIARLKEIEKKFNEYKQQLKEQQQVIVQYDAGSKQQAMQLQASSNYISALEERCSDLTNERDTLKQTCESMHNRIIELENKLGRYMANLAQLQTNAEVTSSQLDKNNNMIIQLEKQLAQAQIEAEKYRKIREILK